MYKLPWEPSISRFTGQGNRGYASHWGSHGHAWDFVMPIGAKILVARAGIVEKVEENFGGIGWNDVFSSFTFRSHE